MVTRDKRIKLHAKQREVFNDEHRFKVVVAGRRWGKTQLSKNEILRAAVLPKQHIWYVAPTYQMARTILWDELKEAIPKAWIRGEPNETRMSIRLHNGTRIALKGADKPDTLRGVSLDLLIMDEAQDIKVSTWKEVLRPTLADRGGRAIFIGTPKAFNWLYDIYMLGQRGPTFKTKAGRTRKNTWRSWQFPTITSPFIPRSEIEEARADMDEKSFRQEFEASFETMSGRVYYAFDRQEHLGDYKFNPALPIWIGMDFNINPMSAVIMQPQKNGEVWVVDECILQGSNTQEVADELQRRYYKWIKAATVYPDPGGASGTTKGRGQSDIDILNATGFLCRYRKKHPKIADRVNAVNRMFKSADGRIKMRVDRGCKHTIASLEQTIYKENSREVDKTAGVEHAADALGYCIDMEFPFREIKILGVSL